MNILDLCIPIHDSSGKKSSIFNWILKLTHFPLLSRDILLFTFAQKKSNFSKGKVNFEHPYFFLRKI